MKYDLHIADTDLTLYAMGALSAAEMDSAQAHLLVCARCKEELRQTALALAAYAQTTPEIAAPAGARERFLAKLSKNQDPRTKTTVRSAKASSTWRESRSAWSLPVRWSGALAGALALLLLVVGVDDVRKRAEIRPLIAQAQRGAIDSAQLNQLMELLTSTLVKNVALHQAPIASPPPQGRVVYAAHTGKLLLTAQNLHPLPAGKTYELWILQAGGKKPLPAGTFAPDSSGNAAMILADEPTNLAVQGFAITIENAGGSDTPTLPIILSGE